MTIDAVFTQAPTADAARRRDWFNTLLARVPNAVPMQTAQDDGPLTFVVSNLRAYHAQLELAGLNPGAIEPGDFASSLRMRDPDGNVVVLTQPGRA